MNTVKTPVHLWIVGVLALLWNAFGAYDYVMSQSRNETYLAAFPPEMIAFLDSFPTWAVSAWAIAVWAAVLGSVLLLLRHRAAVAVFAVAIVAMVVAFVWQFVLAPVPAGSIMGTTEFVVTAVVWVVAIALLVYASRQRRAGVLR